ncbi:hypothetical protein GUITHDRAFT_147306 [Guillardia theta CCMP2712]|uniref:CUB domain-containing protein n=1 Tax=Guillardia theta (strain CCMP2712) TaxID=905079 RepID=L1IE26_GUITC|nr:hypothetical protein GUITHDRAFT_147306 [Guillardia theta CCMP2712]EKX34332.1 hypothetical protein GUITHDRAFT_147306 [Guillardia theta CCMP2712]|eukprot:XP_005821312.1 hypothetical protein GUITHDRAFT_147306 [Guillardia theta CCMP2712]
MRGVRASVGLLDASVTLQHDSVIKERTLCLPVHSRSEPNPERMRRLSPFNRHARVRASWPWIGVLIFLQFCDPVDSWHAFADSEVVPTIPGTNLVTDLQLPTMSSDSGLDIFDSCSILKTSVGKVNIFCSGAVDINCARAWNSAIRDSRDVVNRLCSFQVLTTSFGTSSSQPFDQSSFLNLIRLCQSTVSAAFADYCNAGGELTCSGTCPCSPSVGVSSGSITTGPYFYSNNQNCVWMISGQNLRLRFTSLGTELNHDFVEIFSCSDPACSAPQSILRTSGSTLPSDELGSSTGYMKVTFTSDGYKTGPGFSADWTVDNGEILIRPPASVCSNFRASNGVYDYPVLTWRTFKAYQDRGLGCMGGLSGRHSIEHDTWACILPQSCASDIPLGSSVCFKYNRARGEFNWWNSSAFPSQGAMIEATFCSPRGLSLVYDAITGVRIDLKHVVYRFRLQDAKDRVVHDIGGSAAGLKPNGCGRFYLWPNSKYELEVQVGEEYYSWKGPFVTFDNVAYVGAPLVPVQKDFTAVILTLTWCSRDAEDLSLFLYPPSSDFSDPLQSAIDGNNRTVAGQVLESGTAYPYELSSFWWIRDGCFDTFCGSKTFLVTGLLPAGNYSFLAYHTSGLTFPSACSVASLYSTMRQGLVGTAWVGEQGTLGSWWHLFNFQTLRRGSVSDVVVRVNYSLVNEMIYPGPVLGSDGKFAGKFPFDPRSIPSKFVIDFVELDANRTGAISTKGCLGRTDLCNLPLTAEHAFSSSVDANLNGRISLEEWNAYQQLVNNFILYEYSFALSQCQGMLLNLTILSATNNSVIPSPYLCQDDSGWIDREGSSCLSYTLQPARCLLATNLSSLDGSSASQRCCVCGGGLFGRCQEDGGWRDSAGRSCVDYFHNLALCSQAASFANGNVDAADMCCSCGGGSQVQSDSQAIMLSSRRLRSDAAGRYLGGLFLLGRDNVLDIRAPGYMRVVEQVNMGARGCVFNFATFLLPSTGKTFAKLRWGDRPADLDIYVFPRNVRNLQGEPVVWRTDDGKLAKTDYVWWGLCLCDTCTCDKRTLLGYNSGDLVPTVALDRDDVSHGKKKFFSSDPSDFIVENGPEVVEFDRLLPGSYMIFINAYAPEDATPTFQGGVSVEIYLSDGASPPDLVDVVRYEGTGHKWFFAGTLEVYVDNVCASSNPTKKQADGSGRCYEWVRAGVIAGFYIQSVFNTLKGEHIESSTSFKVDKLPSSSPVVSSVFHDIQSILTPVKFSASGFMSTVVNVSLLQMSWPVNLTVYMFQDDGASKVVLNWGDRPADLDLYVVPSAVVDGNGNVIQWSNSESRGTPYVSWYGKKITGVVAAGKRTPVITLDRDDQFHGDRSRPLYNGPETASLVQLLPGRYDVFVNAYSPDEPTPTLMGGARVDVYLSDTKTPATLVASVYIDQQYGKWAHAGYVLVTEGSCTMPASKQQADASGLCYSWISDAPAVANFSQRLVQTVSVRSAVDSSLLSSSFSIDGGPQQPVSTRTFAVDGGAHIITYSSAGYLPANFSVNLTGLAFEKVWVYGVSVFLVPDDGMSKIVLRYHVMVNAYPPSALASKIPITSATVEIYLGNTVSKTRLVDVVKYVGSNNLIDVGDLVVYQCPYGTDQPMVRYQEDTGFCYEWQKAASFSPNIPPALKGYLK